MRIRLLQFVVLFLLGTGQLAAQTAVDRDPGRTYATREYLERLLRSNELSADSSSAYSEAVRKLARDEAERVRLRLRQGDFQIGDKILLSVESEAALSDTFDVTAGPSLTLPSLGTLSLAGVLRAEVEDHVARFVREFVKAPGTIRVRTMITIFIMGEVNSPGFYTVESEALITDALNKAGGPTRVAKLTAIRVEREGNRVWADEVIHKAIIEGRTLDQIGMRAGDRLQVPAESALGASSFERWLRVTSMVLTIPAAIYGISRLF